MMQPDKRETVAGNKPRIGERQASNPRAKIGHAPEPQMLRGKERPLDGKLARSEAQPMWEVRDVWKRDPERSARQRPRVEYQALGIRNVFDDLAQYDVIEPLARAQQVGERF